MLGEVVELKIIQTGQKPTVVATAGKVGRDSGIGIEKYGEVPTFPYITILNMLLAP